MTILSSREIRAEGFPCGMTLGMLPCSCSLVFVCCKARFSWDERARKACRSGWVAKLIVTVNLLKILDGSQ